MYFCRAIHRSTYLHVLAGRGLRSSALANDPNRFCQLPCSVISTKKLAYAVLVATFSLPLITLHLPRTRFHTIPAHPHRLPRRSFSRRMSASGQAQTCLCSEYCYIRYSSKLAHTSTDLLKWHKDLDVCTTLVSGLITTNSSSSCFSNASRNSLRV